MSVTKCPLNSGYVHVYDADGSYRCEPVHSADAVVVSERDIETALTWFSQIPAHWKDPAMARDRGAFDRLREAVLSGH